VSKRASKQGFRNFPQTLQKNAAVIIQNKLQLFPFASLPIHHSIIRQHNTCGWKWVVKQHTNRSLYIQANYCRRKQGPHIKYTNWLHTAESFMRRW